MASLGQDFVKFDYDFFTLRFNVLDADDISAYLGYWAAAPANWVGTGAAPVVEKWSAGWTDPALGGGVANGLIVGTTTVDVGITQNDFTGSAFQSSSLYYHELTIAPSGPQQEQSTVIAAGTFYVSASIFTMQGYRP